MITLNLISEQRKKEIEIKHLHQLFKKIDFVVLTAVIIIAILVLTAKLLLQNALDHAVDQADLISKNSQGYNAKIKEINDRITVAGQIQDDFLDWSKLFRELERLTPEGVTYSHLRAGADKTIRLRGSAASREDLLALKDRLNGSDLVAGVNLPLSNILEKENISFEINAQLKTEALKP